RITFSSDSILRLSLLRSRFPRLDAALSSSRMFRAMVSLQTESRVGFAQAVILSTAQAADCEWHGSTSVGQGQTARKSTQPSILIVKVCKHSCPVLSVTPTITSVSTSAQSLGTFQVSLPSLEMVMPLGPESRR